MKFRDPEPRVRKYQREGLPNGKRIDPHAYRRKWHETGKRLAERGAQ